LSVRLEGDVLGSTPSQSILFFVPTRSTPAPRPSPTNVRIDEIELTLRKYLIRMDAIDRRFDELRNRFEHWDFMSLHKSMDAVDTLTKKADAFDRLQRLAY
jgi:hypothetical protein